MAPYRTPPHADSEPPKSTPALEERVIYGAGLFYGASQLVFALGFQREVDGLTALALFLGCWGARALALEAWRRARL